eukprot:gene8067-10930_t
MPIILRIYIAICVSVSFSVSLQYCDFKSTIWRNAREFQLNLSKKSRQNKINRKNNSIEIPLSIPKEKVIESVSSSKVDSSLDLTINEPLSVRRRKDNLSCYFTYTSFLASLLLLLSSPNPVTATTGVTIGLDSIQIINYWKYFIAGGICASFSHGITVPIDVIKTRIQTAGTDEVNEENPTGKISIIKMAKKIILDDGIAMLGKGLGPTLVGYAIQGSLKYGFYEIFKVAVKSSITLFITFHPSLSFLQVDKIIIFMIAGGLAELIGSLFLCPFETARIRLVSNPTFANGLIDCLQKIKNEEGIKTWFSGLPAILLKNVPYTIFQLSTFESLTSLMYAKLAELGITGNEVSKYQIIITASAAFIAAFVSTIASQPGDTLLTIINKSARANATTASTTINNNNDNNDNNLKPTESNPLLLLSNISNEIGFLGLFSGLKARLLQMSLIVVIQLLVYDFVKQLVGIPVTGLGGH